MARPRMPADVASVTGADARSPGRYEGRSKPKVAALGSPPKRLSSIEKAAWLELADELPWLAKSDRSLVEVAAKLKARLMTDPEMGVNALAQLRMCLSSMGGSPSDRTKVAAPDEDSDDPADEYLN